MGVHFCPIEPDDWSNGPDDRYTRECQDCGGTGRFSREAGCYDGLYLAAIVDGTCEACGGSGYFVDFDDYEPSPDDVI